MSRKTLDFQAFSLAGLTGIIPSKLSFGYSKHSIRSKRMRFFLSLRYPLGANRHPWVHIQGSLPIALPEYTTLSLN